jgi:hypothetical protein
MTALVALVEAETVLVWDPAERALIAANLRGTMPWTEDAATVPRGGTSSLCTENAGGAAQSATGEGLSARSV